MRFYLVDRVTAWKPDKFVEAFKLTSVNEPYWESFDEEKVMPMPLVLESLCQACAWLVIASSSGRKRATLLTVESVEILAEVKPGDKLAIRGDVNVISEEAASVSGYVQVGERMVLKAKDIMCALVEPADLQDLEEFDRLRTLVFSGAV